MGLSLGLAVREVRPTRAQEDAAQQHQQREDSAKEDRPIRVRVGLASEVQLRAVRKSRVLLGLRRRDAPIEHPAEGNEPEKGPRQPLSGARLDPRIVAERSCGGLVEPNEIRAVLGGSRRLLCASRLGLLELGYS